MKMNPSVDKYWERCQPIKTTVRQDRIWIYENYKISSVTDSVKFTRLEIIGEHEYNEYNGIGDLSYMQEEALRAGRGWQDLQIYERSCRCCPRTGVISVRIQEDVLRIFCSNMIFPRIR